MRGFRERRLFTLAPVRIKRLAPLLARTSRLVAYVVATAVALMCGCISDKVDTRGLTPDYQQQQADAGSQLRRDTEGIDETDPLGLLVPDPRTAVGMIEPTIDPVTGRKVYGLSIHEAIMRTLANSTDIRVVSFDPEIAKQEITKQAAEFDLAAFAEVEYEQQDTPSNSVFESGEADTRSWQVGFRQKTPVGSEWDLSFALTRGWDDLTLRTFSTRYEPILVFQVRQPLLRDAWLKVNLAGVHVSRLNHEITLEGFRQRAEDVAAEVVATYWALYQAAEVLETQRNLYDRTNQTLQRLLNRTEIDATSVQVAQARASLKEREALLVRAEKLVFDAQDALLRLMADAQLNLVEDLEIVTTTQPNTDPTRYKSGEMLAIAMQNNPVLQQRRIALSIADINVDVAKRQRMPRLDLLASVRTQSLGPDYEDAFSEFDDNDFLTYSVGVMLEYPLGNRSRLAELRRHRLQREKAVSELQNVADQVANGVKEALRATETDYLTIAVERAAVKAANTHLTTLEDAETIRERLTPEFLLVKLQAQAQLAQAQRREIDAIVGYNVSLIRLAQASGTALQLHSIQSAVSVVARDGTH